MENNMDPFLDSPYFFSGISISVNETAFHGFPKGYSLGKDDLITVDIACLYKGEVYIDRAWTFGTECLSSKKHILLETAWGAALRGIRAVKPYGNINDITEDVSGYVKSCGFSLVKEAQGHGIGVFLHEKPYIDFSGQASGNNSSVLYPGQVITIEPVVAFGNGKIKINHDTGEAVTVRSEPTAHFEYMVFIEEEGITIPGIDVFL